MNNQRKHITTLTALLMAGAASLPAAAQEIGRVVAAGPEGYLSRGEKMESTDNPLGAIDQLNRFNTLTGEDESMMLARAYYAVGDARCVPLLEEYIASHPASPQSVEARMLLGDFYFFNHDFGAALLVYDRIDLGGDFGPQAATYNYRRALSMIKCGFPDRAVPLLTRLRSNSEYRGPALFYLAYIDYLDGDYDKAYSGFERALEVIDETGVGRPADAVRQSAGSNARRRYEYTPTGLEAGYYMLQIEFRRGKYRECIRVGESLISKMPVEELIPEVRRIVGESYFKLGDTGQARSWLEKYVEETDSPDATSLYALGVADYDDGDYTSAADFFGRCTSENDALAQSAYLYIGQCAIREGDDDLAAMSFKKAYEMQYDRSVAETALYNYITAITRGGNVPFSSSAPLLREFVENYPDSKYAAQVEGYMAIAYYNEKDYDAALSAINRISRPDDWALKAKQKILFQLGVREMTADRSARAVKYLQDALALSRYDTAVASQTALWLGDALYAEKRYAEADRAYQQYIKGDAKGENNALARYNLAYSYYMQDKFKDALTLFEQALAARPALPKALATDALVRKADCLYYTGALSRAAETYAKAISDGSSDADYAAMRAAIIQGVNGDNGAKIRQLDEMMARYPDSRWISTALLEKAIAYSESGDATKAIETFEELSRRFPDTPETRNALLQMAILNRNAGRTEAAIDAYKTIIERWVTSQEAQVAGDDLRAIYASRGDLATLSDYLKTIPGAPQLDDNEVEQLTFEDAASAYAAGEDDSRLRRYVERYPDGRYLAQALRSIAEYEYEDLRDADKALATIDRLLDKRPDSQQAPGALLLRGEILEKEYPSRTDEILDAYRQAEKRGGAAYAPLAWAGIMRNTRDADERIEYARRIREAGGLSSEALEEASYYEALGLIGNASTRRQGIERLEELARSPLTEAGSKAAVTLGEQYLADSRADKAVELLSSFTSSGTTHQYWLARGYITLADAYWKEGKKQLAREYMTSLRENYPGSEADITEMINQRLSKWK